jgi:hypothetical protein
MFPAPPMPAFPEGQSVTTSGLLRYEDVTQDGRLLPIAIPPALGGLWREVLVHHAGSRNAVAQGVIPILTRLVIHSRDEAIRVDRGTEAHSGFVLAHERTGDEVSRLFMNVWSEVRGTAGRLSRNATAGNLVLAGQIFAEHTFTRLLAPPDQRRVTRLAVEGYPEIPDAQHSSQPPATAQEAPPGARWLDELAPDTTDYCLTLDQTDSNQHVNSLVYIRIFLDAVNRRLAAAGEPGFAAGKIRSKSIDIAYRKPSFAGDRLRAQLRLFDHAGTLGAAGFIGAAGDKPRCYVRVLLGA